jgi:4-phospho-D-threonate 3-dehydrogenase / 4-phospho-D-erythronate 3-dehydrogenase
MKPKLAFTIGDVNGIGPEVILKTIVDKEISDSFHAVLIGPDSIWQSLAKNMGLKIKFIPYSAKDNFPKDTVSIFDIEYPREVEYGKISTNAGLLSVMAIFTGYNLCKTGYTNALVTAPISKEAMNLAGFQFDGHTGLLADISKNNKICMVLLSDTMKVGLVTTHIPLLQVSKNITKNNIVGKLEILNKSLRNDFRIKNPKIALLALNPHAGDGGILGDEEKRTIIPALNKAKKNRINVSGPYASDAFFARYNPKDYDAVLAMYHDQGLIPLKMTDNNRGVNFTAGLDIIRTSPDHGTAFDIAGKNKADYRSTKAAVILAINLIRLREKK